MKLTVLAENTTKNKALRAEHGLSLYIETQGKRILFDMGQSDAFLYNAEKLGIDLAAVDIAVLSHGHYDHGGGLAEFLKINSKAPVYINKYAFMPHYNGTEKYIGLPGELEKNERLIFTDTEISICHGARLYPPVQNITGLFSSGGLTVFENGSFADEDFRHEQYLMIEENGRRVLFSGCSHRGICNIVETFRPDVLVGGFHLSKVPTGDELLKYADFLNGYATEYYTCHCTGEDQFEFLKRKMKSLHYIRCGDTPEL